MSDQESSENSCLKSGWKTQRRQETNTILDPSQQTIKQKDVQEEDTVRGGIHVMTQIIWRTSGWGH